MPERPCLTDQELTALARGKLGEAQLDETIGHIDNCPSCQQRFTRLEDSAVEHEPLIAKLGKLRDREPRDSTEIIAKLHTSRQPSRLTRNDDDDVPSVIGPYAIIRKIAAGGMGSVYEGRHTNLGRSVAIKLLGGNRALSRTYAQQVLMEWRANGRLAHPNIVIATDAGLTANRPYLVTELIDGFDLSTLVRCTGPMPLADAATVVHFVAKALEHAHQQGIAHLDIKPSNVMIDKTGVVKLLDLGTACYADIEAEVSRRSSDEFGTLAYLAPERLDGATASPRGPESSQPTKSDLYSLGCTLHFLLTGQPPFGSVSPTDSSSALKIVRAHRHDSPPDIQFEVNEPAGSQERIAIQKLVRQLTAKAPHDRPASMSDVASTTAEFVRRSNLARLVRRTDAQQPQLSESASGHTLELSDLISNLESAWSKRSIRSHVVIIWGLLLAAAAYSLILVTTLAVNETDGNRYSQPTAGGREIGEPNMRSHPLTPSIRWPWKPDSHVGWLHRSEYVLDKARHHDVTVRNAAYESFAPRFPLIQAGWSSDANLFAVLCANGSLRVYRWSGQAFHLEYLLNHAGPDIRRFKWHPRHQMLALASNNHVAIVDLHSAPAWSSASFERSEISELDWLADHDRDLIITVDAAGMRGWDRQDGREMTIAVDSPIYSVATANLGQRMAVVNKDRLSIFRVSFVGGDWRVGLDRDASVRKSSSFVEVHWNRDDSLLLIRKNRVAEIRDAADLSVTGTMVLPSQQENCSCLQFVSERSGSEANGTVEHQGGSTVRLLEGRSSSANRVTIRLGNTPERQSSERIQSEIRGAQLHLPLLVPHPHEPLFAVVCMGQIQVWDNDFETVFRGPSLSVTAGVQPLQLQSAVGVFQADGHAVVVQSDGKLACEPIPPMGPRKATTYFVRHNAIVEPTLDLIQATKHPKATDSHRNLTQWGLERRSVDRTTWGIAPPATADKEDSQKWPYRWANLQIHCSKGENGADEVVDQTIHSEEGRLVSFDPQSERYVIGLDNGGIFCLCDGQIIWSNVLPDLGSERCLLLERGGNIVFAAGADDSGSSLVGIDVSSQKELWEALDSAQTGNIRMARYGENELIISSKSHWAIRQKTDGKLRRTFDPFHQYGIHNSRVANSEFDESLYSYHSFEELQPVCSWSDDLTLQWLAFSTGPRHWIVLDADGREIVSVGDEMKIAERVVTSRSTSATRWASTRCRPPQFSLRILCTHADGHVSIQPF